MVVENYSMYMLEHTSILDLIYIHRQLRILRWPPAKNTMSIQSMYVGMYTNDLL